MQNISGSCSHPQRSYLTRWASDAHSPNHTMRALNMSLISESLIDERVTNLFKIRFRSGQFDPHTSALDNITNASTVCTPYAIELARDGVAQGTTLLKNEHATLPLDATKVNSIAVMGPMLGHTTTDKLSSYYGPLVSCGNFPFYVGHHKTMIDAVQHYIPASRVSMHCGTSVRHRINSIFLFVALLVYQAVFWSMMGNSTS